MVSFTLPKNPKYRWTNHVARKMRFYGLTPSRILRVIRTPERVEKGIVEHTLAAMQTAGTKAKPWEVWTMWREDKKQKVIITAWRYPGVSPVRDEIPIPASIVAELKEEGVY